MVADDLPRRPFDIDAKPTNPDDLLILDQKFRASWACFTSQRWVPFWTSGRVRKEGLTTKYSYYDYQAVGPTMSAGI